ncbi:ABC transporter ATP-binding protein, partial [Streptomyces sp. NPDC060187]
MEELSAAEPDPANAARGTASDDDAVIAARGTASEDDAVIATRSLSKRYRGGQLAVDGLDLTVPA